MTSILTEYYRLRQFISASRRKSRELRNSSILAHFQVEIEQLQYIINLPDVSKKLKRHPESSSSISIVNFLTGANIPILEKLMGEKAFSAEIYRLCILYYGSEAEFPIWIQPDELPISKKLKKEIDKEVIDKGVNKNFINFCSKHNIDWHKICYEYLKQTRI